MRCAVVLFTRDLRVHDLPALTDALAVAETVVPLFVLDDGILDRHYATPNRVGFLVEALADLRASLRHRGGDLVVRRGDVVDETMAVVDEVGAGAVFLSAEVARYGLDRERRLADACRHHRTGLVPCPGITVVPPGDVTTGGGDNYQVFTPYWRRWSDHDLRPVASAPGRVPLPGGLDPGAIPAWDDLVSGKRSPEVAAGGEGPGRELMHRWLLSSLADYGDHHDDLAGDDTSRLSPYLHFGCLSPRELVDAADGRAGAEPFVRQVCWRDFHHQMADTHPDLARRAMKPRGDDWSRDERRFVAWCEGRTGYPIVDAGMRQLHHEGWMHNRARLITGHFLCKDLYLDWRWGARHFFDWLLDGDIVNNSANWQWVAGTGADRRPNRVYNPVRQAERYDPSGDYVRRWVPELADVGGKAVHRPWDLDDDVRAGLEYPDRLVEHDAAAFRARREG